MVWLNCVTTTVSNYVRSGKLFKVCIILQRKLFLNFNYIFVFFFFVFFRGPRRRGPLPPTPFPSPCPSPRLFGGGRKEGARKRRGGETFPLFPPYFFFEEVGGK